MRTQLYFYIFSAAVMLLLPAGLSRQAPPPEQSASDAAPPAAESADFYRVLETETGTVRAVSVRDYLIGAVGAEMPASFAPEALKAQVVASHTYAERMRQIQADTPDPALCGADFSDDSNVYQAFFTEDDLRTFYGEAFTENYAKLAAAVDAAGDLLLCYEDEPIVAAFHAISSGTTESAEAVWGTALPYLVSVPSESDRSAPQYEEVVKLSPDAVRQALLAVDPDADFPKDPAQWFSDMQTTEAGTVLQIRCGGVLWSGSQLREALALRSACFTVTYDDMLFLFTTRGFGHDVGMSQYGANAMAAQGSSYEEILAHYYPDTELVRCTGT